MLAAVLALAATTARAAPAPAPAKGDVEPDWLRKPSYEQLQAVWPMKLNGDGSAVLHCRVNPLGLLENCKVADEKPAGSGVGAAALLLAPNFVMRPAMKDGQPVAGGVNIPVRFSGDRGLTGPVVHTVVHPYWKLAPNAAQVAAVTPRSGAGEPGHVGMRCDVKRNGRLRDCQVLTENPPLRGFGGAARRLAPLFQLYVDEKDPPAGRLQVNLALAFEPPGPGPRFVTAPDWTRRPTPTQSASIFPDKAARDGLKTGVALVECVVQMDGSFAGCEVREETPAGEGFGEAALRLIPTLAIAPWSQDGRPTDGAHIRVPIRLNAAAPAEPAATPQP
jgi:hypothetical protein